MAKVIILATHRPNGNVIIFTQEQQKYMIKNHDRLPVSKISYNLGLKYQHVYQYMRRNKLSILRGREKQGSGIEQVEGDYFDVDIYFRDIVTV
jgi:hypothetical protein